MNFAPKSPAELDEERKARMKLMDPGPADFVVRAAVDTISSSDKTTEQIELTIEVTDAHGNTKTITDWLTPKMMEKMRNFCYGTGVGSLYESGQLMAEHCDGLSGRCQIAVEKGGPDPKGGRYPDKNKIRDYIPNGNGHAAPAPKSPAAAVPESAAAMRKAQSAFKAKHPQSPRDELIEGWNQAVKKYFFGKKPELVTAGEWEKFAADGFVKPAVEQPFGDDAQFKEDDIPF